MPVIGDPVERFLTQVKDAIKAGLLGGMLFEDLGFRYIGPVDGHNIRQLQKYLRHGAAGPRARCCCTWSPRRGTASSRRPRTHPFHAPAPVPARQRLDRARSRRSSRAALHPGGPRRRAASRCGANPQGGRHHRRHVPGQHARAGPREFPDRFFDVGICESHAVAFAAGLAKAGLRPIVDIYSTFLQRSYDQIFQEVALQNLPVTLLLDRAGLVGPDGPTHHGVFDLAYLRPFPNWW